MTTEGLTLEYERPGSEGWRCDEQRNPSLEAPAPLPNRCRHLQPYIAKASKSDTTFTPERRAKRTS